MTKPPAFQFYADDFLAGVADMTQAEVGAYILLLCHQWNRGSAPVEPERQQLLAKGPVTDHVISKFEKQVDGSLKNERMEKERDKQAQYREKQRVKGVNSGESRRAAAEHRLNCGSTAVQPTHEPKANRKATLPSPSPSPLIPPVVEAKSNTSKSPNHEAFIKGWVENYKVKFGVDYKFDGGRDGKAVKQLLSMGILLIDLLEIAKKAWDMPAMSFACRQARTIHGFHHQFNPIQTEVRNGSSKQAAAAGRPAGGNF